MNINRVIFGGRVVATPELKSTTGGTQVSRFTLVANRKYKDKEDSTFVEVSAFGRLADACRNYLAKGGEAIAIGELRQDSWTARDGRKINKISIVAEEVHFVGGSRGIPQNHSGFNGVQETQGGFLTEEEMIASVRFPNSPA